ncbi:E3 ISG15--protein ligase HERC5-like [Crotalus tigris]|uniref:E3 ISG15--protein ligase HERC5-like n=1 Tax=Crotalus tigris TaxID=88082 RepID=UPI00192F80C6|nr:E3 ISG15--protein ligase HERC5-like [Crotalus tigris]
MTPPPEELRGGFQRSDTSVRIIPLLPANPSFLLPPKANPLLGQRRDNRRSFDFLARHAFSLTFGKSSRPLKRIAEEKPRVVLENLLGFFLGRSRGEDPSSLMPGAGKRRPGGATSSPGGSLSRPTRSFQKPGKKVAEKMRERRAGAEGSDRLSSPAVSSPPLRAPLLLFPRVGYHHSIFKEDPEAIRQISCKQGYLAMAQTPNTVQLFCRAQDEQHQPALVQNRRSICLKEKIKINSLDCEASHLLILLSNGKLSEHDITTQTPQIRLLKELTNKYIVQIACGDHHSMALSKGGELFAWGENEHGQLGVEKKMGHVKEPQPVLALEGIPLIMIAAGSAHSMVVSIFGTVYSWGKNTFGQLGLGDTEGEEKFWEWGGGGI